MDKNLGPLVIKVIHDDATHAKLNTMYEDKKNKHKLYGKLTE
jgi:hypothetical protein